MQAISRGCGSSRLGNTLTDSLMGLQAGGSDPVHRPLHWPPGILTSERPASPGASSPGGRVPEQSGHRCYPAFRSHSHFLLPVVHPSSPGTAREWLLRVVSSGRLGPGPLGSWLPPGELPDTSVPQSPPIDRGAASLKGIVKRRPAHAALPHVSRELHGRAAVRPMETVHTTPSPSSAGLKTLSLHLHGSELLRAGWGLAPSPRAHTHPAAAPRAPSCLAVCSPWVGVQSSPLRSWPRGGLASAARCPSISLQPAPPRGPGLLPSRMRAAGWASLNPSNETGACPTRWLLTHWSHHQTTDFQTEAPGPVAGTLTPDILSAASEPDPHFPVPLTAPISWAMWESSEPRFLQRWDGDSPSPPPCGVLNGGVMGWWSPCIAEGDRSWGVTHPPTGGLGDHTWFLNTSAPSDR